MLLFDGDILVYRCGFAADKDRNPSLEFAKYNIKSQINKVASALHDTKYKIYLTGKDNFRFETATLIPYKNSRKKARKPIYYNELREYMQVVYSAVVVNGIEADDAMGIEQCKSNGNTTIVSIDKDLDMIPGWHYNFVKQIKYEVTPLEADRNFYKQVLTGDRVDDIPGLHNVGKTKALKLLEKCNSSDEMDQIVTSTYKKAIKDGKLKLNGITIELNDDITVESILEEIKTLLWIKRK